MKKIVSLMLASLLVCMLTVGLVACNKQQIADNTEYYDSITKTLTLTKAYEGKSFLKDGIGSATLDALVDGDTTRFKLAQGNTISVRYYCIDTPESTGTVEKWGKAASLFVKEKLSNATEIVLEATETPAVTDSYGVRYLGYVWYKTADSDFKNLNLELIENGFTQNKAINTSAYPYYEYMNKATVFAQSIKLRIFSELDDPLYSTDPVEMTIKDFWENTEKYYTEETDSGAKVEFVACLTSLYISNSETHTYTAVQYDPETNETYSISVYCAYASSAASRMEIGHLYRIIGSVQNYYDNFQISGISYDPIFGATGEGYTTEVQKNYYLTFDSDIEYNSRYISTLYTDVTVVSSKVENTTLTIVGTAQKRTSGGTEETSVTFTFTVPVSENFNNTFTEGTVFSTAGFQLVKDSQQITLTDISDIKK